jgi:hypothetical protein
MFPKTRDAIASVGVGIGLPLGLLGMFISFVPGAAAWWFGTAAGTTAFGMVSPSWRMRIGAVVLALAFSTYAWLGYQDGLRYREWLQNR